MTFHFIDLPIIILLVLDLATTCYGLLFALVVWLSKKSPDSSFSSRNNQFLVLVPAHNEEEVVDCLIDSLNRGDYPRRYFSVLVIADNCSDKTVQVAQQSGAQVLVRTSDKDFGKQHAIHWALGELKRKEVSYDALLILDADNVVLPNLLSEANRALNSGADAYQAPIANKNPGDSWVSRFASLSFAAINCIHQPGRALLGINPLLCGTGMGISRHALAVVGWPTATLKEDKELTIRLALHGFRTVWLKQTAIYDERPTSLKQSNNQLSRWYAGDIGVAVKYIPTLVRSLCSAPTLSKLDILIQIVINLVFAKKMLLLVLLLLSWDKVYFSLFVILLSLELVYYEAVVMLANLPVVYYWYAVAQEGFKVASILGIMRGICTYLFNRQWLATRHGRRIYIDALKR